MNKRSSPHRSRRHSPSKSTRATHKEPKRRNSEKGLRPRHRLKKIQRLVFDKLDPHPDPRRYSQTEYDEAVHRLIPDPYRSFKAIIVTSDREALSPQTIRVINEYLRSKPDWDIVVRIMRPPFNMEAVRGLEAVEDHTLD